MNDMSGNENARLGEYEVLSPWAEADPIPARGITPRLAGIDGKKIGLFANGKRAALPMLAAVERELKKRFPKVQTDLYRCSVFNTPEVTTHGRKKFEAWVGGIDAVVLAVGD
jgi:hypothetical protein